MASEEDGRLKSNFRLTKHETEIICKTETKYSRPVYV